MRVIEQMTEAQERMLRGMEAAQEQIVDVNRRVAEAMTNRLAESDRLSIPKLPGAESLPSPDEIIDRSFDFAAKIAETNRSFYKDMVSVWAPAEAGATSDKTADNAADKTADKAGSAKKASKSSKSA